MKALEGLRLQRPDLYVTSAAFIMLAMILDGLDGVIARGISGTSEFGAELDTFVDFTAFGLAPAILLHAISLPTENAILHYLIPCLIVVSGATRLARFRVIDPLRGQGGFTGLPITVNATWISFSVFSSSLYFSGVEMLVASRFAPAFFATIVILIGLQLSTLIYPKIVKNLIIFFSLNALLVLVWFLRAYIGIAIAGLLMLGGVGFVLFPIVAKIRSRRSLRTPVDEEDGTSDQDLLGLLAAETSE